MAFGIALSMVVLGVAVAVATRPDSFRIERTATIRAPVELIFAHVNDFQRWVAWSPFEKLDRNLKRSYDGAVAGVGAIYRWEGNAKAGRGSMEIKESVPNQRIAIELQFDKPIKAKNLTEFRFEPSGDAVTVSWAMSGDNTLMGKAFSLFVSMDKLLGKDFEEGLSNLSRATAEAAGRTPVQQGSATAS